jgi:hypothetical protein
VGLGVGGLVVGVLWGWGFGSNRVGFHAALFSAARSRLDKGLGDPPGLELRPRGPLLCGPVGSVTPYAVAA